MPLHNIWTSSTNTAQSYTSKPNWISSRKPGIPFHSGIVQNSERRQPFYRRDIQRPALHRSQHIRPENQAYTGTLGEAREIPGITDYFNVNIYAPYLMGNVCSPLWLPTAINTTATPSTPCRATGNNASNTTFVLSPVTKASSCWTEE